VIDTHAWIWQLFNPSKLGQQAKKILEQADNNDGVKIIIPAVVLAEVCMIAQKQRIANFKPEHISILVSTVKQHPAYSLSTLNDQIILASQQFTDIPDIFDRLIATETYLLNAHLVSCDSIIRASQVKHLLVW
jgi:PIN domain nuclease of toxin-antitoxin system